MSQLAHMGSHLTSQLAHMSSHLISQLANMGSHLTSQLAILRCPFQHHKSAVLALALLVQAPKAGKLACGSVCFQPVPYAKVVFGTAGLECYVWVAFVPYLPYLCTGVSANPPYPMHTNQLWLRQLICAGYPESWACADALLQLVEEVLWLTAVRHSPHQCFQVRHG
jgi:hypothetical protein